MRRIYPALIPLLLVLSAGYHGAAQRPSPYLDFTVRLRATGPIDVTSLTRGVIVSVAVLEKNAAWVKVRFTCPDGGEYLVEIPIDDGYVETGCTSGGKKVRIRIRS